MRINQNIMAFNAFRNLTGTNTALGKSLEKLSSGYRINRAADDASGLVISQGLRAQVGGLRQATRNAQDGVSVVQTAEGALGEVHSMLNRMRDLVIQAGNTGASDANARQAAQNEISQLRSEINRIGQTTAFGTQKLLDGSFGAQAATVSGASFAAGTGVVIGAGATTTAEFTLVLDAASGASLSVTVRINSGTYATAASYQAEVQRAVNSATNVAGFTNSVTIDARDLGSSSWAVDLVRNSTNTGTKITVGATMGADVRGVSAAVSATVANTSGGIFQVGANVTATDQIQVAISDLRVTGGTNSAFKDLASVDATVTTNFASAQTLIDHAITEVSNMRGRMGATQNRFESTIANLSVTTENLSASESRIRDTDMAAEMVSFTRHQILLQAGTAMLGQANSVPQSVLRLLS
jgi:flagellin